MMGIRGITSHEQLNASADVDFPQTPTPVPIISMTSPRQQVSSSQQVFAIPVSKIEADADVPKNQPALAKKVIRPKRDRKKFSMKIRLPPSQILNVNQKSKRKALQPADENAEPKAKTSKSSTAETPEMLLKCLFCPRLYRNKWNKQTHQRECDENPEKEEIQCEICEKIMKVTSS
jgi:hypothetical protein